MTHTAARWPPIQTASALVFRAVHILNTDEQVSAAEVRRRYALVLDEMQQASADPGTDPLVKACFATFLKVTASYGDALFWCYDHPDLPRTNNDLEHRFGSLRYHERRASGRKQVAPMLLLRGQARVLASVSTRLHTYRLLTCRHRIWLAGVPCGMRSTSGKKPDDSNDAFVRTHKALCSLWKSAVSR